MTTLSVHHVGIKVSSVDAAIASYAALGIPCHEVVDCPEVGLRIACLTLGNVEVELVEVVSEDSPIAQDPDGFHHMAVATADIDRQYQRMQLSEVCDVQGEIRRGLHNNRLFFYRMKDNPEVLYECVQSEEECRSPISVPPARRRCQRRTS